jgi:hypothetical protein
VALDAYTANQLIALAKSGVDAEVFEAAFMHYMPGSDGLFEELITVIALYQPEVFLRLDISAERVRTISDLLQNLREKRFS